MWRNAEMRVYNRSVNCRLFSARYWILQKVRTHVTADRCHQLNLFFSKLKELLLVDAFLCFTIQRVLRLRLQHYCDYQSHAKRMKWKDLKSTVLLPKPLSPKKSKKPRLSKIRSFLKIFIKEKTWMMMIHYCSKHITKTEIV